MKHPLAPQFHSWPLTSKSQLTSTYGSQDALRQICIKISERAPEFGMGVLLPELLQDTGNWDILLIGLQTLITILLSAPARQQASKGDVSHDVRRFFIPFERTAVLPLAILSEWRG
jgi:hypothetical protein